MPALTPAHSALLFSGAGIAVHSLLPVSLASPKVRLAALTLLLAGYLAVEIGRLRLRSPDRWLLNPAVLASFLTFLVSFALGNVLFLMPEEKVALVGLLPEVTPAILKLVLLVLLGAVAMWSGYWSPFAALLAVRFREWTPVRRLLRGRFELRPAAIVACLLACLGSRLLLIALGIYGYSSDPARLAETASYRQYLVLAESLGKLALFLVAMDHYNPERPSGNAKLLAALLGFELFFGFLSGFKSAVAMPFVILGVSHYLMRGRIPWRIVSVLPLAIVAAYYVIEPFRLARYSDDDFRGTDMGAIASTMVNAALADREAGADLEVGETAGTGLALLARASLTEVASLGIGYADTTPLPPGSPAFLKDIFLAPLYAVVPRAIWSSKEMSRHGLWYVQEVMGIHDLNTAVGMSPFTYLYFAGGGAAVVLGFYFIGSIQRFVTLSFMTGRNGGATIVFALLLPIVAIVDSVFFTTIVELIRMLVIGVVLQSVLLKGEAAT